MSNKTKKQQKRGSRSTKSVRTARKVMNGMSRKERTDGIAYLARELVKKGYTNERVFQALQKRFGKKVVDEAKRHYPQYYRRELVAKGEITESFAQKNAHE